MRRDIAALWLAFSHQERTLKALIDRLEGPRAPDVPTAEEGQADPEEASPAPVGDDGPTPEAAAAQDQGTVPVAEQLSDLDDVLASIERATEVLERSHADEIGAPAEPGEPSGPGVGPPDEDEKGEGEDPANPAAGAG